MVDIELKHKSIVTTHRKPNQTNEYEYKSFDLRTFKSKIIEQQEVNAIDVSNDELDKTK